MGRKERIFRNAGAPSGLVFLNFKSKSALPKVEDVPTLVPSNAMDFGQEPFFKIEAIDFPAMGSGGVYDGSFFKSFINVTKDRPIPGSKRGHEWISRPASDFYTVGGRIDSLDNGKTGTAFLKIFIPPIGDPTENAAFIRDAKAGIVHFSLVTRPDYNVKTEKDEMGNPVQVRHFTATMGAERNDAMEYGAGAMAQLVNSSGISLDLDAARALIEAGQFDRQSKIEGEPVQNGVVYRSALRVMLSRANEQDRPALAELVSMIDKSQARNGGKSVDKEEALKLLSNLIKNGAENIQDVIKGLGIDPKLLRNETDEANEATVKALNAKLGVTEKPLEKLDAILIENGKAQAAVIDEAVEPVAGPKTIENAEKKPIVNPAHTYAAGKVAGLSGEALKNGVEALKKDPILIALNAQRADGESGLNRVVNGGKPAQAVAGTVPAMNV